jgi:hypothetical protein
MQDTLVDRRANVQSLRPFFHDLSIRDLYMPCEINKVSNGNAVTFCRQHTSRLLSLKKGP